MRIDYLITPDSKLFGLLDVIDMFREANNLAQIFAGDRTLFDISIVGTDLNPIIFDSNLTITPDACISPIRESDIIIVPAFEKGDFKNYIEKYAKVIDWLTQQHENGKTLVGLCSGSFLVAATHLLDGKSCTTHWVAKRNFEDLFPNINLEIQYILVKEERIITSGGSTNALYAVLYLIHLHFGKVVARHIGKLYEIETDRLSQSHFEIFIPNKSHNDTEILDAQKFIENNFSSIDSIDKIANRSQMGKRQFFRRFKDSTSETPFKYLQKVRIEAAKDKLTSTNLTVSEIAFRVGYGEASSFRKVFKEMVGIPPDAYRRKNHLNYWEQVVFEQ